MDRRAMDTTSDRHNELFASLKDIAGQNATSEQLFDLVLDMRRLSASEGSDQASTQVEMCEDVLEQLVHYVELEARCRISKKISALEDAPRRIVCLLAIETIRVAQPVLTHSPVLEDEDLLMVTRRCGTQHLEAIAERKTISKPVTNELVRLGNTRVWEKIATNKGADLSEKATIFLTNRARDNVTIQLGLIDRPDLSESRLKKIVADAGEEVRQHLKRIGRTDLLPAVKEAEKKATKRVLSTSSVLGYEYEETLARVLRIEEDRPVSTKDLRRAIEKQDFPLVACFFSRLSQLDLDEAVHWLSSRELDPAVVAFKALAFDRDIVVSLLKTGPWQRILTPSARAKALATFDTMNADVALRIFQARNSTFSS